MLRKLNNERQKLLIIKQSYFQNLKKEKKSQMSARDNLNAQIEHLQSKYIGTGHSDISK